MNIANKVVQSIKDRRENVGEEVIEKNATNEKDRTEPQTNEKRLEKLLANDKCLEKNRRPAADQGQVKLAKYEYV